MITQLTVTVGLTQNLGNYSNVKPEINITSQILPNESAQSVLTETLRMAQAECYELVDQALEAQGDQAKFSLDARYHFYVSNIKNDELRYAYFVPVETPLLPKAIQGFDAQLRNARMRHIEREVASHRYTLLDEASAKILPIARISVFEAVIQTGSIKERIRLIVATKPGESLTLPHWMTNGFDCKGMGYWGLMPDAMADETSRAENEPLTLFVFRNEQDIERALAESTTLAEMKTYYDNLVEQQQQNDDDEDF